MNKFVQSHPVKRLTRDDLGTIRGEGHSVMADVDPLSRL